MHTLWGLIFLWHVANCMLWFSTAHQLTVLALQIQDAKIFQERALSALLDQNPGSREAGEWSPSRLYLLLPLQSHDLDDNPHPPVDWECVKKLISDPMFVEDQDCLNEPTSLQTDWSSSSFSLHTCTVQLANGRFPVEAILDSVVETTHSREAGPSLFCGCELILDLNANSPMRNQGIKKNFSCYAQYFSEKYVTKRLVPSKFKSIWGPIVQSLCRLKRGGIFGCFAGTPFSLFTKTSQCWTLHAWSGSRTCLHLALLALKVRLLTPWILLIASKEQLVWVFFP